MRPGQHVEAGLAHEPVEELGVAAQDLALLAGGLDELERPHRAGHDGRGDGVGEEVGPGALPQQVDDLLVAGDITPEAPPRALPSVPVMMSTRSMTPKSSGVPRPPTPMKPTACESSTKTRAPNSSARSQIPSSGAYDPSIEKTPSVTMTLRLAPAATAASSCARRSPRSAFL